MTKKNILEDIELRSESVQEVLSNPPSWILRYGISIIFMIMTFTLIGSWFVKYPDIISAKAVVTSVNPPERLESKVNSRIAKIYVTNSKKVKKGDVLAILESTANYQDVLTLTKAINAINTNYQNFSFPFDKLKNLELGEIQTTYIQFHQAYIEHE
jgi:multidrug efflux pump subunit AcrA (membrane-fusion protein)